MAKSAGKNRKKQSRHTAQQASPYTKALAREANKYLGAKFNTRKKHLSKYATYKVLRLEREGLLAGRLFDPNDRDFKPRLTTIPIPKGMKKQFKNTDYEMINGRLVVLNDPATVKRFKKRLKEGFVTGVNRVGPNALETVKLPYTINTFGKLIDFAKDGELDALKNDDEFFAFKLWGHSSRRIFRDQAELLETLQHYKFITDEDGASAKDQHEHFQGFELVRFSSYPWGQEYIIESYNNPRTRKYKRRKKSAAQRAATLEQQRLRAMAEEIKNRERNRNNQRLKLQNMTAEELDKRRKYNREYMRRKRQQK